MAKFDLTFSTVRINPQFLTPSDGQRICMEEITNTIARTNDEALKGRKADGTGFPEYSEPYKEKIRNAVYEHTFKSGKRKGQTVTKTKKKAGKGTKYLAQKGGKTSPSNLFVSGKLHGSRRAFKVPNGAEGRFTPGRGNPAGQKNPPDNPTLAGYLAAMGYPFMEFGQVDIDRINKRFEDEVKAAAEKNLILKK